MTNASQLLDSSFINGDHIRRFVIRQDEADGWEVREEEDSRVIRDVRYTDWHRVERARAMIQLTITGLTRSGWKETAS